MARGRKKKPVLSIQEQEDTLIEKLYIPQLNDNDELEFVRSGNCLSLEETALALWMSEGRKTAKPMSAMAVLKIQQRALEKLRKGLKEMGINSLEDVLNLNDRQQGCGTVHSVSQV